MLIRIVRTQHSTKTNILSRAAESALAHRAASQVISALWNGEPALSFEVIKDALGKPRVNIDCDGTQSACPISWAHAYPYALAAGIRNESMDIGADIERVRRFRREVITAFLTDRECAHVLEREEATRAYHTTLTWSIKEAILKSIGLGLRLNPRRIDVTEALTLPNYHIGFAYVDNIRVPLQIWKHRTADSHFVAAAVAIHRNYTYTLRNGFFLERSLGSAPGCALGYRPDGRPPFGEHL